MLQFLYKLNIIIKTIPKVKRPKPSNDFFENFPFKKSKNNIKKLGSGLISQLQKTPVDFKVPFVFYYFAKNLRIKSFEYSQVSSISPKAITSPAKYVFFLPCKASTFSYHPSA